MLMIVEEEGVRSTQRWRRRTKPPASETLVQPQEYPLGFIPPRFDSCVSLPDQRDKRPVAAEPLISPRAEGTFVNSGGVIHTLSLALCEHLRQHFLFIYFPSVVVVAGWFIKNRPRFEKPVMLMVPRSSLTAVKLPKLEPTEPQSGGHEMFLPVSNFAMRLPSVNS